MTWYSLRIQVQICMNEFVKLSFRIAALKRVFMLILPSHKISFWQNIRNKLPKMKRKIPRNISSERITVSTQIFDADTYITIHTA